MSEWPGEWDSLEPQPEPEHRQHNVVNIEGNLYLFGDEKGQWLEVNERLPAHLENRP